MKKSLRAGPPARKAVKRTTHFLPCSDRFSFKTFGWVVTFTGILGKEGIFESASTSALAAACSIFEADSCSVLQAAKVILADDPSSDPVARH